MRQGLFINSLRGDESTGLAIIRQPAAQPEVWKKAMSAPDFLQMRRTDAILNNIDDAQAVLGHTRSATKGSAIDVNAHPFQYDHITLIHNGHVNNWKQLDSGTDIDVDSAHVAAAIARHGELETLQKIQGGYVLMWHNARDQTINIAKNDQRPLHYAMIPDWGGYAFSSEYDMLGMLLGRNDIKIEGTIKHPKEMHHFKFELNNDLNKTYYPFLKTSTGYLGPPDRKSAREVATDRWNAKMSKDSDSKEHTGDLVTLSERFFHEHESLIRQIMRNAKERSFRSAHQALQRPQGTKPVDKAKDRLRARKLTYGTGYGVDIIDFTEYKDSEDRGVAVGQMIGMQYRGNLVEIHNVSTDFCLAASDLERHVWGEVYNVKTYEIGKKTYAVVMMEIKKAQYELIMQEWNELQAHKNTSLPMYLGPCNEYIQMADWIILTQDGCSSCQQNLNMSQHEDIYWIDKTPVCASCLADPVIAEALDIKLPSGKRPESGQGN